MAVRQIQSREFSEKRRTIHPLLGGEGRGEVGRKPFETGGRGAPANGTDWSRTPHSALRIPHLNGSFPVFILGWTIGGSAGVLTRSSFGRPDSVGFFGYGPDCSHAAAGTAALRMPQGQRGAWLGARSLAKTEIRLGRTPHSALSIPHLNGSFHEFILGWTTGRKAAVNAPQSRRFACFVHAGNVAPASGLR